MEHSRKPTEQETDNIVADMVRLYRLDENLMPDMCGREDIVGHELNTDEDEARSVLSGAKVIVTDMDERAGVIFWGGEFGIWVSILTEVDNKLCLIAKEHIELMYWGTSGK